MVSLNDPLLIYTDLDGTLLDHESYDWSPARPWLARLRDAAVPVIINTSKTAAEVEQLRHELDLYAPYTVENGSVVVLPPEWCVDEAATTDQWAHLPLGASHDRIVNVLAAIRENEGLSFRCFSDMDTDEVAERTALSKDRAALAKQRQGSEPMVWEDTPGRLAHFQQLLTGFGLTLTRGGRFYHVMGDEAGKGRAVHWLTSRREALHEERPCTIGLGDGPNDVSMLEACDMAVAINAPHGQALEVDNAHCYFTRASGPAGWDEGLTHWISLEGSALDE